MQLFKTKSGWAKEVVVSTCGKWRKCTLHNVPLEVAERMLKVQLAKGRRAEIRGPFRPCADGRPGYQVWAVIARRKVVCTHATTEECLAAGVQPGPMN